MLHHIKTLIRYSLTLSLLASPSMLAMEDRDSMVHDFLYAHPKFKAIWGTKEPRNYTGLPRDVSRMLARYIIAPIIPMLTQQLSIPCTTLTGHSSPTTFTRFTHDCTMLATTQTGEIAKLWDIKTGQCLRTFTGHDSVISSVQFNHDGTLIVTTSYDWTAKLWDPKTGQCLHTFNHNQIATCAQLNHDDTQLVTASYDGTAKLWNTNTGQCLQTFTGHDSGINSVQFNHDGTLIATTSCDYIAKRWDTRKGKCPTLISHNKCVNSAQFNHDGTLLTTASSNQTVKLWDIKTGKCLHSIRNRNSAKFYHDNSFLVIESKTNRWDLRPILNALRHLQRELTLEQAILLNCMYETRVQNKLLAKRSANSEQHILDLNDPKFEHLKPYFESLPTEIQKAMGEQITEEDWCCIQ